MVQLGTASSRHVELSECNLNYTDDSAVIFDPANAGGRHTCRLDDPYERARAQLKEMAQLHHLDAAEVWDADGSGLVDMREFTVAARAMGFKDDAAKVLFDALDRDGSGTIEYEELEALFDDGPSDTLDREDTSRSPSPRPPRPPILSPPRSPSPALSNASASKKANGGGASIWAASTPTRRRL